MKNKKKFLIGMIAVAMVIVLGISSLAVSQEEIPKANQNINEMNCKCPGSKVEHYCEIETFTTDTGTVLRIGDIQICYYKVPTDRKYFNLLNERMPIWTFNATEKSTGIGSKSTGVYVWTYPAAFTEEPVIETSVDIYNRAYPAGTLETTSFSVSMMAIGKWR